MFVRKADIAILVTTYNHYRWLGKALDGILAQKTRYSFIAIVHDDASTDGTDSVLRNYEKKYPDKIIAMYEKTNQYHTGSLTFKRMLENVKCKYVAICEGDDFWIDNNKLEKQIDYMESHSECTFTCSDALIVDLNNKVIRTFFSEYLWKDENIIMKLNEKEADFSSEENILLDFVPTASCIFTTKAFEEFLRFPISLDLSMRLICTEKGYMHYFSEQMTAYRVGNASSASGLAGKTFESMLKEFYQRHYDIYQKFNEYTNYKYSDTIKKILQRKYLIVLLKFEKFKEAINHPAYSELRQKVVVKIFVKRSPIASVLRPLYRWSLKMRTILKTYYS